MNKFLLITLLSIFSLNASGQYHTLIDTNKIWSVYSCVNFGPCGTTLYHFGTDTIISSYTYKKLVSVSDSGAGNSSNVIAVREDTSTRKVYFYSTSEYLVYDFSLNEGDTFRTNIGVCQWEMVLNSIDTVSLLNGEQRRRFLFGSDTWIDGVGSLNGFPFPWYSSCISDAYYWLACFAENDTLKYHNINYSSCSTLLSAASETKRSIRLTAYPNPTSSKSVLSLSYPESSLNQKLLIHDITGKELARYSLPANSSSLQIKLPGLAAGLYVARLEGSGAEGMVKFVVE